MNLQFYHPYPRYGFAAALVQTSRQLDEIKTHQDVANMAIEGLQYCLNHFSVFTNDNPTLESTQKLRYDYLSAEKLQPGKKEGQISAKGYFMSPYILTSDGSAANAVAETRSLLKQLLNVKVETDLYKPTKLKRSFAPLTAKVNNGNKSASEPTTSLFQAAFTAIATLTELKPSVYLQYEKGKYSNAGVVADLPLRDHHENNPLRDFIALFGRMRASAGDQTLVAKLDAENKKYRRPLLHQGNFPNRPVDYSLNSVSLMAAIGEWVKANPKSIEDTGIDRVKEILHYLADRPLYIVSYEFTRQERFSHQLVDIAFATSLPKIQRAFYSSNVFGVEKKDDPKHKLFRTAGTHFLQFFNKAAFQDLLSFRAEYPPDLLSLFNKYFKEIMADPKVRNNIIASAKAFGQSINRAAYFAAKKEKDDDEKSSRKGRTLEEYKARILTELESRVDSATSHLQLLHQICVTVARMTGRDIDAEADVFMEAVAQSDDSVITLQQAKHLITAFMRLRSVKAKPSTDSKNALPEAARGEFELTEEEKNTDHLS